MPMSFLGSTGSKPHCHQRPSLSSEGRQPPLGEATRINKTNSKLTNSSRHNNQLSHEFSHLPTNTNQLQYSSLTIRHHSSMEGRGSPDKGRSASSQPSEIDSARAWFTLACVFVLNATTLGSLKVYGLIFEEIVSQKYYSREQASWPVSTASTIQNLAGVLTPLFLLKVSWRSLEVSQTILFVAANVGAYFSRTLITDILCLGIIQGVAFSIRYNMNVVINNEYFDKYRATAMGISLAGSTCGVFFLKPYISYVLDISEHRFRNAYLALACVMSLNLVFNCMIRKPRSSIRPGTPESQGTQVSLERESPYCDGGTYIDNTSHRIAKLLKNPSIHCVWVMQTIYFYISRTYTIFIVDYGIDMGFSRNDSRSLLEFWVYGEIAGRLLLGWIVDSRILSLKWNIIFVNLLLAFSGYALLIGPNTFNSSLNQFGDLIGLNTALEPLQASAANETAAKFGGALISTAATAGLSSTDDRFYWFFGMAVALVAALSSLTNMLIVPFGQEYLGKGNVPWAFAIGSLVTSFFLLLRPSLIGLSRDYYKSYSLLILVMSTAPCSYSLLFCFVEPCLRRRTHRSARRVTDVIY